MLDIHCEPAQAILIHSTPTCALYRSEAGCWRVLLLLLELPSPVPWLETGSVCCCCAGCLLLSFSRNNLAPLFNPDGTLRGRSVDLGWAGKQGACQSRLHERHGDTGIL